jgi:hypothetical protein
MFNAQELLDKLNLHPLTRQIVAEEKAKVIEARKEAALERDKLLKELGKIPSNEVATCDLSKELNRLETECRILKERIAGRIAQNWRKRQELENRISTIEGELIESADSEITKAVSFFLDRHQALRHATISRDTFNRGLNLITLNRELETATNAAAIAAAMAYCLRSVETLGAMRFSPEVDTRAIQELVNGIPDVDGLESFSHQKAAEKAGPAPALWALPSDSEMDWKKNRALKEADRLLKK